MKKIICAMALVASGLVHAHHAPERCSPTNIALDFLYENNFSVQMVIKNNDNTHFTLWVNPDNIWVFVHDEQPGELCRLSHGVGEAVWAPR